MPYADYEIPVRLQGEHAIPDIPSSMQVGETVHYTSNDGSVTVEFRENGSPFIDDAGSEKTVVSSTELPVKLSKAGTFTCRCFITPLGKTNAERIGWDPVKSPQSGGNHVVKGP